AAAAGEAALTDVGRRHGRGDRSLRCRTGAEGVNIRAGDRRGARETGGPPPSRSGGRPILTPSPADRPQPHHRPLELVVGDADEVRSTQVAELDVRWDLDRRHRLEERIEDDPAPRGRTRWRVLRDPDVAASVGAQLREGGEGRPVGELWEMFLTIRDCTSLFGRTEIDEPLQALDPPDIVFHAQLPLRLHPLLRHWYRHPGQGRAVEDGAIGRTALEAERDEGVD